MFVAAAAGEAVAVLLYCPPLLVLVVVMLLLFVLFFPQVTGLARCRHRVLGGARMVDVSATRSESELPNSGKFVPKFFT